MLTSQPKPPAHAGRLWPVIKGLLAKDADQRLTADQAAPLLAIAAQPPDTPKSSRRRRRRFTPDTIDATLVAPPPTIASPTDLQPAPTDLQPAQGKRPPDAGQPAPPASTVESPAPAAATPTAADPATVAHEEQPTAGLAVPATVAGPRDPTTRAADTVAADTMAALPAPQPRTDPRSAGSEVPADTYPQPGPLPGSPTRPVANGPRIAGAAAVVAGVIALTVTVMNLATQRGEGPVAQPAPSPSQAMSPSVSASPSPSYRPGVDPCLLGTWRTTTNRAWGLIDDTRVLYTGGAGTIVTFRADGTARTDYSKMRPRIARYRGNTWSDVHRGTVSSRYYADDGTITDTVTKSNAVDTLRRNGKVNAKTPVTFFPEPSQYRCTGKDLYTYSLQGNFSSEMVRVS